MEQEHRQGQGQGQGQGERDQVEEQRGRKVQKPHDDDASRTEQDSETRDPAHDRQNARRRRTSFHSDDKKLERFLEACQDPARSREDRSSRWCEEEEEQQQQLYAQLSLERASSADIVLHNQEVKQRDAELREVPAVRANLICMAYEYMVYAPCSALIPYLYEAEFRDRSRQDYPSPSLGRCRDNCTDVGMYGWQTSLH